MTSSYKRLLPSRANSKDSDTNTDLSTTLTDSDRPGSSPRTCSVSTIACDECRRRKAKCGGQRPICDHCARNGTNCHYDANVGETRSSILKKRHDVLNEEVRQLRDENRQFKKLYGLIRTATEDEAFQVFLNIRSSSNYFPIAIPFWDQDDKSLAGLPASHSLMVTNDEATANTPNACFRDVQAVPWTVVADDDVVSELISQYFTFDYLYVFPPIPRAIFIYEMKRGDPASATACTPLLVNAICAQQSFLSPKDSFGITPRRDMAERFLRETKTLLQSETKRTSLPTCQATCLMHAAEAMRGKAGETCDMPAGFG